MKIEPAQGQGFEREFDRDSMVIGRSSTSDLTLADPFLSRHHARIFRDGDKILIEDLGSRNGTLLNGVEVASTERVEAGDTITVSGSTIRFFNENEDPQTQDYDEPITDVGATIFKPATELLGEESSTHPSELAGEQELRRYAERLKLFNEIHEALTGSMELTGLLELILLRAFEHLGPEQGAIFLRREEGQFERVSEHTAAGAKAGLPLSRSLIKEVCEKNMAALVLDTATDVRFAQAESIILSGVRSLIAAPLFDNETSLGMIVLSSRAAARQFVESDLEFLVSMASVAAMKIRNVELAVEAAERKRMEQEIAIARDIQLNLLQEEPPIVEGLSLYADNVPSRGVSGDYYSIVVRHGGDQVVLMVADVSGKGVPASILTASLEALSAGPIEDGLAPAEICARVSRQLYLRTPPEKYATVFLAALEPATGRLFYTNAGHNPAVVARRDGSIEELATCGMPVGLLDGARYEGREIMLEIGETLVIYTDGITEAENKEAEEFGLQRLSDSVSRHRDESLEGLASALETDLETFIDGEVPADDRTLVMARRTGS